MSRESSLMKRIPRQTAPQVRIVFEGENILAFEGDTVAAALLAGNHLSFRTTPVGGRPRGPFCMMGACFECLVEIDGVANRQACMIPVCDGMHIKRQSGAGDLEDNPFSDSRQKTPS
jgi:predicted molibdopterin-dependent oxidoreductase YjgC